MRKAWTLAPVALDATGTAGQVREHELEERLRGGAPPTPATLGHGRPTAAGAPAAAGQVREHELEKRLRAGRPSPEPRGPARGAPAPAGRARERRPGKGLCGSQRELRPPVACAPAAAGEGFPLALAGARRLGQLSLPACAAGVAPIPALAAAWNVLARLCAGTWVAEQTPRGGLQRLRFGHRLLSPTRALRPAAGAFFIIRERTCPGQSGKWNILWGRCRTARDEGMHHVLRVTCFAVLG